MASSLLNGLIQDTFVSLKAREYSLRKSDGYWSLWRLSPTGWIWLADFADRNHAEELVVQLIGQEDRRPA